MRITNINLYFFLIPLFLFACHKDQNQNDIFQRLNGRMWKEDSIVYMYNNGLRYVSIPPTMNSLFVKFTSTQIQYYYSSNMDAPVSLENDAIISKDGNILGVWFPGQTGGPASYKIVIDNVNDTLLRYSFLNTPDYTKEREYYYHIY